MGQKYIFEIKHLLKSKNFVNQYKILIIKYNGYKDLNEYLQAIYKQNTIQNIKIKEKKVYEITH